MATVAQSSRLGNVLWPALAWIVALIFFFPIFWLVFTSFKTDADAVKPEHLIFFTPTLENYTNMTENYDYWRFAINSVIVSTFATFFALVVGVPSAYAMAFDPSRHTKDILMWMLSTKMLPAAAVLYPMTFLTKNFLGIFDTHFLVIVVLCLINLPIVIWMLFTYFKEIPKDLFRDIPELSFVCLGSKENEEAKWQAMQDHETPMLSMDRLVEIIQKKEKTVKFL